MLGRCYGAEKYPRVLVACGPGNQVGAMNGAVSFAEDGAREVMVSSPPVISVRVPDHTDYTLLTPTRHVWLPADYIHAKARV
jgi:hypothetical protein